MYFHKCKRAESMICFMKQYIALKLWKKIQPVSYLQCLWLHLQPCTINNLVPFTIYFQPSPLKCNCAFNSVGKRLIILIRACQGANFNPLLPQPKNSRKTIGRTVNFYHLYPNTGQPEAVTHFREFFAPDH